MEQAGASLAQIADAFRVSTRTASRWRERLGLQHQEPHHPRPRSDRDHAAALLDDGCSFAEVARTLGVTGPTIRRWFPDRRSWTREERGAYAAQARRFNEITTTKTAGRTPT
ncbi:helix-turn-helix domain-containing protein [Microbacterium resistens]|uniref:helix-turn-helix domain-containing protein n=1 Tax=Microbacterium resistens TaxID=156977 RepID=UPI0037CC969E